MTQNFEGIFANKPVHEIGRLRNDKRDEAMAIINKAKAENRNLSKDEIAGYDAINSQIEQLNIELEKAQQLYERKIADAGEFFRKEGTDKTELASEFRTISGKKIPVADRDHSLPRIKNETGLTFGDYCRVIATGANTDQEKRALEGYSGSGSYSIPTAIQQDFIDLLRSQLTLVSAGCKVISVDKGVTRFVKLTGDPTSYWHQENADDITLSDPSCIGVDFKPKTVASMVKISRELLRDSVNVAAMIERSAVASLKQALETAILWGNGSTANVIEGLYNNTSITKGWPGTNGGALTSYQPFSWAEYMLMVNNSKAGGIICSPQSYFAMQSLGDTSGQPMQKPSGLASIPVFVTTAIPANQTRGTSTTTSGAFVGNWADLVIAIREDATIEILKERYADTHSIGFKTFMSVDAIVLQPKSFAWIGGINLPSSGMLTT